MDEYLREIQDTDTLWVGRDFMVAAEGRARIHHLTGLGEISEALDNFVAFTMSLHLSVVNNLLGKSEETGDTLQEWRSRMSN